MKQPPPEERDPDDLELERIRETIASGAIEDIDELDPVDLALLVKHHGSIEEVEKLFDSMTPPTES